MGAGGGGGGVVLVGGWGGLGNYLRPAHNDGTQACTGFSIPCVPMGCCGLTITATYPHTPPIKTGSFSSRAQR